MGSEGIVHIDNAASIVRNRRKLVLSLIHSFKSMSNQKKRNCKSNSKRDEKEWAVVNIPENRMKYVIGKGGFHLREIEQKSCAVIQIDSDTSTVFVYGTRNGINTAFELMQYYCSPYELTIS